MFQFAGWMRKNFMPGNFSWRASAEKWDASWVFQTLATIFSELKRCIFQISLKYIKLQKYSLKWYYAVLIYTSKFKITWPPQQYNPSHQNKNFWDLSSPAYYEQTCSISILKFLWNKLLYLCPKIICCDGSLKN